MKKKLEILLEILMSKNYSQAVISQAIMLPMSAKNPKEFMNQVIEVAKSTDNEIDFYAKLEKLIIVI